MQSLLLVGRSIRSCCTVTDSHPSCTVVPHRPGISRSTSWWPAHGKGLLHAAEHQWKTNFTASDYLQSTSSISISIQHSLSSESVSQGNSCEMAEVDETLDFAKRGLLLSLAVWPSVTLTILQANSVCSRLWSASRRSMKPCRSSRMVKWLGKWHLVEMDHDANVVASGAW